MRYTTELCKCLDFTSFNHVYYKKNLVNCHVYFHFVFLLLHHSLKTDLKRYNYAFEVSQTTSGSIKKKAS